MNIAIILAGGSGSRMGKTQMPKQFLQLHNKPVLAYSLITFNNCKNIDKIFVVCSNEYKDLLYKIIYEYKITKFENFFNPGRTRSESSWNALIGIKQTIKNIENSVVLIHDGARPLVTNKIIEENIQTARDFDVCETVLPCSDTIIQSLDNCTNTKTLNRNQLFTVQTPQSFKFDLIYSSYYKYFNSYEVEKKELTDDISCIQLYESKKIYLIEGDKKNLKLTTPQDFIFLESFIKNEQ